MVIGIFKIFIRTCENGSEKMVKKVGTLENGSYSQVLISVMLKNITLV